MPDDHEWRAALAEVLARRGISAEETVVESGTIVRLLKQETPDPGTTGRGREQDTPPKIRQLLERLGIDPRDPWVWITTERPLSPDHTRARIDDGGAARWISLTEDGVKAWNGYSFDLIGLRYWEATHGLLGLLQDWGDDLLLDARYMRMRWQQSALYSEYVASEREGVDLKVGGFLLTPSQEDRDRAEAGLALLVDFQESQRRRRGRPRLEESPSSPWRAYAEQARDLLTSGEVTTIKDATVRLGLPQYDEARPDLDGRAEKTAAQRLGKWLQRLKESEDQHE